jgi:hypothetical protein
MQVDDTTINIPGINGSKHEITGYSPIYIPLYDHVSSDEFVRFHKLEQKEQWRLIILSLKMMENNRDLSREWDSTEYEEDLRNTKKEFNSKIKRLQDKNKKIIAQKEDLEETIEKGLHEYEVKLEQTRHQQKFQTENMFKTKVEGLEKEIEVLKEDKNGKETEFYKNLEEKTELIRENYEVKMEELRQRKNKELEELREKLYRESSNINIAANKGSAGEELVGKWLTDFFPTAEFEDTAQQGGKGDMLLTYKNKKYLVEVKTDKKNVQKVGVKKFEKEMRSLKKVDGGIFISLNSGVCGKTDWSIQMYGDKPAIYLCRVKECPKSIIGAVDFLYQLMVTKVNVQNVEATTNAVKNYKKILLQNTSKLKTQITDNNDILMKHIERINDQVSEFVKGMINNYDKKSD